MSCSTPHPPLNAAALYQRSAKLMRQCVAMGTLALGAVSGQAQELGYPYNLGPGSLTTKDTSGTTAIAEPAVTPALSATQSLAPHRAPSPVPPSVIAALNRAHVPLSALSALVVPVNGVGGERLRHQADRPVNPASVMKLVTTYAAMDLLGADFTWRTDFFTDGPVSDGSLRGNLYVRGGGDPKLVLERIQAAFLALQEKGVKVILGDMVLDHGVFDLPKHDPGRFDGEALRPYNASPDGLLVNFKSVVLTFQPDTAAGVARVMSEPPMAGLAIDATVPLAKGGCGDWRDVLQGRFDDPNAIRFVGSFSARCGEKVWPVAYHDPESYAERAFEGLWRASGGAITGQVRKGTMPAGTKLLYQAKSLPLSDIIADVNQWSNNVMAQQVFLTLGRLSARRSEARSAGPGTFVPIRVGRWDRSRETIATWWKSTFGIRSIAPVMENGSGLSRTERITPDGLASLLQHASRHPQAQKFMDSLAVAGVSGTATRLARGTNSAAKGNAWIKTGTLNDVTGIAGYVDAQDGTRYAVVGFVNHPNATAARPALDAILEWTASQTR